MTAFQIRVEMMDSLLINVSREMSIHFEKIQLDLYITQFIVK